MTYKEMIRKKSIKILFTPIKRKIPDKWRQDAVNAMSGLTFESNLLEYTAANKINWRRGGRFKIKILKNTIIVMVGSCYLLSVIFHVPQKVKIVKIIEINFIY